MPATLIPVNDALQTLLGQARLLAEPEEVPLRAALGRVLAESRQAGLDVPAYDNSAMDGYAARSADVPAAGTRLPVSQTIAAGHPGTPLQSGTAARIFTGAAIPDGADCVVIQEDTASDGDRVVIREVPAAGQNIRPRGHDIRSGTVVLEKGHRLQPHDLGLLASLGIARVSTYRPLKVAIVNTGDEVVEPGQALAPGQLYDSNSYTLQGLLERLGMQVLRLGIVKDTLEATRDRLRQAAEEADCIVTTGGVSVGDEDHVRQAVQQTGEIALWKLAIKPGKPFSFGRVAATPFFGLPGNPVAVFVTFVTLVRPCLLLMQGATSIATPAIEVPLGFDLVKSGSRQEYLRVRLVSSGRGHLELIAFPDQGSSIMTSLSWADGLAVIPAHSSVAKGELVKFMPFNGLY